MAPMQMLRILHAGLLGSLVLGGLTASAQADSSTLEKTILREDAPLARGEFSIAPDGKRLYFAGAAAFFVFDEHGDLVTRVPVGTAARTLLPLKRGGFLVAQSHALGRISALDAAGNVERVLVNRGHTLDTLRADGTGWTSPTGIAFDAARGLLFALDTTQSPKGLPDPDFSRIAVFDANGKYQRSIAAYDSQTSATTSELRTWYDDIEVDPAHSRLYVTARANAELWAFDYDGTPRGRVPGVAGIAVLPHGSVAVVARDRRHVEIYDAQLRPQRSLDLIGGQDLETDASGRLYASSADPSVLYVRWTSDLARAEVVRPRYDHISVQMPFDRLPPGEPFTLTVAHESRPVGSSEEWHVFARPADGSTLQLEELVARRTGNTLVVSPPRALSGLLDIIVRFGPGTVSYAEGSNDLHVEKTVLFRDETRGRIGVRPVGDRSAFRRGETIALRIALPDPAPNGPISLQLRSGADVLVETRVDAKQRHWQLPAELTERLLPGHYEVSATLTPLASDPLELDIADAMPKSPLQRILYHEFDQPMRGALPGGAPTVAEQLDRIRSYVGSVANLAFTRETDRSGLTLSSARAVGAWRYDTRETTDPHDAVPIEKHWEPGYYLDRATALGVRYDTQILAHCAGVPLADSWFGPLDTGVQQLAQWFGRYPSFYGFNYNDELFFQGTLADSAWLSAKQDTLASHARPDAFRAGLTRMYGELDRSVERAAPDLSRTATPMWQFPAVEGSYAPTIYEHMTESYAHYLSEGFAWPFYAAHAAEMLRRPGLPLMGVFDNGYGSGDGEFYAKDAFLVLGRGVQGIGVEHATPLRDAAAAAALRFTNELAEAYGPIFSEVSPKNEATILYSYTQDVTEHRDTLGTPHWERVLTLYGAGLMAGLPMSISYEEDLANGSLLEGGKPKIPFVFLVGQKMRLPAAVGAALEAFRRTGGRIIIDRDSVEVTGAERLDVDLLAAAKAARSAIDTDSLFPLVQPSYESIAQLLSQKFAKARSFAVDTSDPWVAKNHFDGGEIQYVALAAESRPLPWGAGTTWSLGGRYTKSHWPSRVELTVPTAKVIYDVLEHRRIDPGRTGDRAKIDVDLRYFPGRLYALGAHALEPPQLSVSVDRSGISVSVNVGANAQVPLKLSLADVRGTASVFYRGTDRRGEYRGWLPLPVNRGPWRLYVSELLGGKTTTLAVQQRDGPALAFSPLPKVEIEREQGIRELVRGPARAVHIVRTPLAIPDRLEAALVRSLKEHGLRPLVESATAPSDPATLHVVLTTTEGSATNELVRGANRAALFGRVLGANYPGPGRGFIGAVFGYPSSGRDNIVVVGGDAAGLETAAERLIALLTEQAVKAVPPPLPRAETATITGVPAGDSQELTLSHRIGPRLSALRASHGKLLVSAAGYLGNLARVDDEGVRGRLVAAVRLGDGPASTSPFMSGDGKTFGLAARSTARFGEAFFLASTEAQDRQAFTSFGDAAPGQHAFAATPGASTVLAPGPFGVVAWRRQGTSFHEAWAIDYWKKFDRLSWSLASDEARIPGFDTQIPVAGDIALVTFTELSDHPWLSRALRGEVSVSARALDDGAERWTFTLPSTASRVTPKVYAGQSGAAVLVQAEERSSSSVNYYSLARGHLLASWSTSATASVCEISERTQRILLAYGGGSRVLEIRDLAGAPIVSRVWRAQPIAAIFAEDGAGFFVADDAGMLSRLDEKGDLIWQKQIGTNLQLALGDEALYAAGWDGRLRSFDPAGNERWQLDLTSALSELGSEHAAGHTTVYEPQRASTSIPRASPRDPSPPRGDMTVTVGGTPGWKSEGRIGIEPSMLTNGKLDDAVAGWLPESELYMDATAFRKVWVELNFELPARIHTLTVHENPAFPESWPTESLIQVWDETAGRWSTAKRGLFLHGSTNIYALDLRDVKKLRYVPWSSYFRNFHTSEIEVR